MKGYASCKISAFPLPEMREGKKKPPLFYGVGWKMGQHGHSGQFFGSLDQKWNEAMGTGEGKLLLYDLESFTLSTSVCLLHVSHHKFDNKSVIKLAIPRKRFLQTMLKSKLWVFVFQSLAEKIKNSLWAVQINTRRIVGTKSIKGIMNPKTLL